MGPECFVWLSSTHPSQPFSFPLLHLTFWGLPPTVFKIWLDWTYQNAHCCRQTKPGGWIEVVENGPTSSSRICSASIADENEKAISRTPSNIVTSSTFGNSNIACWIKQQLIDAGFVEVEEKVWKVASKPWQRTITGIGRFIVAFLSMRWVWDDTGTIYQEKGPEKHYEPRYVCLFGTRSWRHSSGSSSSSTNYGSSWSVFVIARRPWWLRWQSRVEKSYVKKSIIFYDFQFGMGNGYQWSLYPRSSAG